MGSGFVDCSRLFFRAILSIGVMTRLLRMEYEDGINRGNYRADLFASDRSKGAFMKSL